MIEAMLTRILAETHARRSDGGEYELGEGKRLTLYVAHDGASLSISRIETLRLVEEGILVAKNDKGERFFVSLADVYALSAEAASSGGSAGSRKPGFLSDG
ncbi:MAG: hypothetical protein U0271_44625 [Polyangiaceae bacterium]